MSIVSPLVRTSRVFEATLAVFDALQLAPFPVRALDDTPVPVFLVREPGHEFREFVSVLSNNDPAIATWASMSSATSDESIVVDVLIRTMIHGEESRPVVERLAELADVVQMIAYDVDSGKPKAIGFTNESRVGRARDVSFDVQLTEDGFVGEALVRFALAARI